MWIVSIDIDYYPRIEKFKTESDARNRYEELIEWIGSDRCVFLSKVDSYKCGNDYKLDYENN